MSEDCFWDIINATRMGQYLTTKEQNFIDIAIGDNTHVKTCLEIGAGSGRFSIPLYKNGFDIVALDLDLISLRKLHGKNGDVPLLHAEAHYLPFKDSTFDCVLAMEVLEEAGEGISSIHIFLSECYRVLKYNGILLVIVSNKNSYKGFIRSLIRKESKIRFYQVSYKEYVNMLHKFGFTIQKVLGFNWLPASRKSNSKIIPMCSFIETTLKLQSISFISPWVFIIAKKQKK